ncbi:MAG: uroporphyrinogen decarboxylase [Rhodospirillales bacterium]|jgi:uroporphyrinogen decarboxylase|nr:uroporphyrinogen decarboxylase [Rhodospirillaceae bacterium]MDP6428329.1 uroporphyrinogen decarboxylase [Rhodospirillales bacterium]MDP6642574.1 uroporphyrinogen decarboxylase [Rhodospirillales bacterium]MDP6842331.1 uroporphyrinogen decarboxylase [Rhodospirillales bacterium]|tara:strand:- start:3262 stop:4299 length:1038 start_codon:yes stop_codon:yes gene_type:complete
MNQTGKPLLRTLMGSRHSPPPIWLMRQAGRHLSEYRALREKSSDFLNFCYSPELAVEATMQPVRRYRLDAAILFSDILVIPDAFGQGVRFVTGEGPKLDAIADGDPLPAFDADKLHDHLSPVYETVARLADELPDMVGLIGFAGAPWTVATYMVEGGSSRDYQKIRSWAYQNPDSFQILIDLLVDATAAYLGRQISHGAEAVQLFDSWAGVLPPVEFERWVIQPTAEIVRRLRIEHGDIPVIGFPRGAGAQYPVYAEQAGVDCISLDQTVPLDWAAKSLPQGMAVQGNLDNLLLLAGGEAMADAARAIIAAFSDRPHIFNLGHGILPETPPEHVERLCAVVRGED